MSNVHRLPPIANPNGPRTAEALTTFQSGDRLKARMDEAPRVDPGFWFGAGLAVILGMFTLLVGIWAFYASGDLIRWAAEVLG